MNGTKTLLSLAFIAIAGAALAQDFNTEAGFKSALKAGYYTEDFSGMTFGNPLNGTQTDWDAPGNGTYNFHAFAGKGLYSGNANISVNVAYDALVISFANSPNTVTAFGGLFSSSDSSGNVSTGDVSVLFDNGHTVTLSNPQLNNFYGFVNNVGIASVTINVVNPGDGINRWIEGTHFIVGQGAPVPEPSSIAVLGLGAVALLRRRRK